MSLSLSTLNSFAVEYNDYPVEVTRITQPTQYSFASGSAGEWRQHNFQFTVSQPYYPSYTLSFTANSQYGDNYLKWVSIYDADYRLVYSSGWVSSIDNIIVPSPFQDNQLTGTVHVYERVMRDDRTAPPQNEMNSTAFVFRGQFRNIVTNPASWYAEYTTPSTSSIDSFPAFTTSTFTSPNIPDIVSQNVSFMGSFFTRILNDVSLHWLVVFCILIGLAAWLLH